MPSSGRRSRSPKNRKWVLKGKVRKPRDTGEPRLGECRPWHTYWLCRYNRRVAQSRLAGAHSKSNVLFQGYVLQGLWIPGKGMEVLQNFQKFWVRVWKCYRTHRSLGYCGTGVQNSQKFRAGIKNAVPVTRVFVALAYRTYRSSGYGYDVVHNLQKFRARV